MGCTIILSNSRNQNPIERYTYTLAYRSENKTVTEE